MPRRSFRFFAALNRSAEEAWGEESQPRDKSLARSSVARLGAEMAQVFAGGATGVIAARTLGPATKGIFSSLVFVVTVLFFYVSALGCSDGLIVLRGKKQVPLQTSLSPLIGLVLLSSVIGAAAAVVTSFAIFGNQPDVTPAILAACISLPVWLMFDLFIGALNSIEEFELTSLVTASSTIVAAATMGLLVTILQMGLFGAVLSTLALPVVGLVATWVSLRRRGIRPRPSLNYALWGEVLRYGIPIQGAYILIALSQRVDQLIVFGISGPSAAGWYSVSLAIGWVGTHAATSLSMASFPRVAASLPQELPALAARLSRMGLAATLIISSFVALITPFAIPFLFGPGFRPAVIPTLILIVSGVLWGEQWLLARALAARGRSRLLLGSFATNVLVMVTADLFLIRAWGVKGAALGSALGAITGLALCVASYRKEFGNAHLKDHLPGANDFKELARYVKALASGTV